MTPNNLENAEARIRETRQRLLSTVGEVQERLRPSALAHGAVESAAQGVASVARKGAEAVRARPFALAAIAGTIGLVMARGWIADIVKRRRKTDETARAPKGLKTRAATPAKKGSTR